MMNKLNRLLLCAMLCVVLALSPLVALGEGAQSFFAQVAVSLPDGSQQLIPAAAVVTSMGDTVYWIDYSQLTPEQTAALSSGALIFTDEAGNVLGEIPYALAEAVYDMPSRIADPVDPELGYTLMFAGASAPTTAQEADAALAPFGFAMPTTEPTEEPTVEPTAEPTIEPTIEPTTEPTVEPTVEPTEEPTVEPTIEPTAEPTVEPTIEPTVEPTTEPVILPQTPFYVMSDNLYSNSTDLYDAVDGAVVGELDNGTVLYVSDAILGQDGVWYAVVDPLNEEVFGFLRAELTLDISDEDALAYIEEMLAAQQPTTEPTVEPTSEPVVEPIIPEVTAEPTTEPTEEPTPEPVQSSTFYAVTSNQNSNVNNLRESVGGSVLVEVGNGELMWVKESIIDGEGKVWYAVDYVRGGVSGYMRDYLLTRISDEDAQVILAAMATPVPTAEATQPPVENTATPAPAMEYPNYGITIEQQTTIVLRTAPGADLPTSGAIPTINKPTPVELLAGETDANGTLWYLVRSMNDDMSGYVEAYNVRVVTKEEAENAVSREEATPLPPVATEEPVETPTPIPTPTPTPEPTPTPIPEDPQALNPGDVYHYGRTNKAQVNLREKAKQSSDSLGTLPKGTVLWVMTLEKDWCHVRAYLDNGSVKTGYIKSEFVTLMGENEEIAYRATLSDPEVAPETPTPAPTETPTVELITPEPTAEPTAEPTMEATAEPTATPSPLPTETPIPTATPDPIRLDLYARVINDATPLRGNPDANAYLQTILDAETVVYLFQSQVAEDGMTWYLVQYAGQWGYIRADLVRVMGTQETEDYKAALEAEMATPTPMPQVTPEPVGPNSTSAYAKLIKDSVNLRRTPSASGTSLGRIPVNTLLLVMGEEYDGTYTWYLVNYNGQDGYVRSDMAQMLTIAELQNYLAEQATATPNPSVSAGTSGSQTNSGNNVSNVINGTPLQDLIPVPDGWTSNVTDTLLATATPDPSVTATPAPISNPAVRVDGKGTMTVNNVPASTQSGGFAVYGKTKPYAYVKATIEIDAEQTQSVARLSLIPAAIAEGGTIQEVGATTADAEGNFTMNVTLPQPGEYIVEFTADEENFARYGVTYEGEPSTEPTATAAPLPTVEPIEEENGFGLLPVIIGGLLIIAIAVIYGIHVFNRRAEENEEDLDGEDDEEDDEDEEDELREQQRTLNRQRHSAQSAAMPRMPKGDAPTPSFMKPTTGDAPERVSPYARPMSSEAPKAPTAPKAPVAPVAPKAPVAPTAPVAPKEPTEPQEGQPRRRRRNTENHDA